MITDDWMRWQEMERSSGGGGSDSRESTLAPGEFGEDKRDHNSVIAAFDAAGVGLRASELMLLGTNQSPAGRTDVVDQFRQPTGRWRR